MATKLSKAQKVRNYVNKFDATKKTAQMIDGIMKLADLKEAAAKTYLYNARASIKLGKVIVEPRKAAKKPTTKKGKKATAKAKKAPAPKVAVAEEHDWKDNFAEACGDGIVATAKKNKKAVAKKVVKAEALAA